MEADSFIWCVQFFMFTVHQHHFIQSCGKSKTKISRTPWHRCISARPSKYLFKNPSGRNFYVKKITSVNMKTHRNLSTFCIIWWWTKTFFHLSYNICSNHRASIKSTYPRKSVSRWPICLKKWITAIKDWFRAFLDFFQLLHFTSYWKLFHSHFSDIVVNYRNENNSNFTWYHNINNNSSCT